MPGVVEEYVAKEYQSEEFGSVWRPNVVMPDGRLGMSERRSHFVFHQNASGQFEAHLVNRSYLHQDGHIVHIRNNEGRFGHRCVGAFEGIDEARQYARQFIADYKQTAAEEHIHAVKHQQREDYYSVHGVYPKHKKEKETVRGPRMRL